MALEVLICTTESSAPSSASLVVMDLVVCVGMIGRHNLLRHSFGPLRRGRGVRCEASVHYQDDGSHHVKSSRSVKCLCPIRGMISAIGAPRNRLPFLWPTICSTPFSLVQGVTTEVNPPYHGPMHHPYMSSFSVQL